MAKKDTQAIGEFYNRLQAEGKSGKEVYRAVNEAFGTNYKGATIRYYGFNAKKKMAGVTVSSEQKERKEQKRVTRSERKERKEYNGKPSQAEIEQRMRIIAKEVFQEMNQNITTSRNEIDYLADIDIPPEPQVIKGAGKGRHEDRKYKKISLTLDETLWKLFMEECSRLKISTGRLLDIIMWRHYGRPKLSFETEQKPVEVIEA